LKTNPLQEKKDDGRWLSSDPSLGPTTSSIVRKTQEDWDSRETFFYMLKNAKNLVVNI